MSGDAAEGRDEAAPRRDESAGPDENAASKPRASVMEPASAPASEESAPSESGAGLGAPSWRELARRGEHESAYRAAQASGVDADTVSSSADDLLLLADAARLSGRPRHAVDPLERLIARHGTDPRAAVAAIMLGRIEMDVLRRPERAHAAFMRALALGVPRALESDVRTRLRTLAGNAASSHGSSPQ